MATRSTARSYRNEARAYASDLVGSGDGIIPTIALWIDFGCADPGRARKVRRVRGRTVCSIPHGASNWMGWRF